MPELWTFICHLSNNVIVEWNIKYTKLMGWHSIQLMHCTHVRICVYKDLYIFFLLHDLFTKPNVSAPCSMFSLSSRNSRLHSSRFPAHSRLCFSLDERRIVNNFSVWATVLCAEAEKLYVLCNAMSVINPVN